MTKPTIDHQGDPLDPREFTTYGYDRDDGMVPWAPPCGDYILLADVAALLPSDLGDLTVLEHLQRMAEDAARYRWLRDHSSRELPPTVTRERRGWVEVRFTGISRHKNVSERIDASIDEARSET